MNMLFEAVNNVTETTNGAGAYKSTLNKCLDLFFCIGTARGADMTEKFNEALKEDKDLTLRILQWVRDVRGGAGERERFRSLLKHFAQTSDDPELVAKLIRKIPEIGRFDDCFALVGTKYENQALSVIGCGILDKNGLAAKWAPRRGEMAVKLRNHLGFTPKRYRKTIVELTKVVETQMCAGQWDEIEYRKVPSVASRIYASAFGRHSEERYKNYLEAVLEGTEKMNASAIFPHDVLRGLNNGDVAETQVQAQWQSLPNYLEGTDERILPVVDVSGSMAGLPMEISVALGLYFSERLEGLFKDCVITFETEPQFIKFDGSANIQERARAMRQAPWGGSTDFVAVFQLLLGIAVKNNIPAEQLPTKLLCVSDMQFNQSTNQGLWETTVDTLKEMYKTAGYEFPQLVFWNASSSDTGNVPVTFNESGVALVSGASPSIVKVVIGGELNPIDIMNSAVGIDRYKLD